jgi:hypothetical protein
MGRGYAIDLPRALRASGVAAAALLLAGLASSQPARVDIQIDDTGAVIPQHQERHVKNGQVVRWRRTSTGSWFVIFRDSPCENGEERFGTADGRPQTCTISVECSRPGDPGCKSYRYSSATSANATMHDPEIVVDN